MPAPKLLERLSPGRLTSLNTSHEMPGAAAPGAALAPGALGAAPTPSALRAALAPHALRAAPAPSALGALTPRRLRRQRGSRERALERAVATRTRQLQLMITQLHESQAATISHLARAVEMRDSATHDHIDRIGQIAAVLARALDWRPQEVELMRLAAPMHDVGKIGISDRILLKPGPLTPAERREMQRHTLIGHQILSGSESQLLELAASIALNHHERYDGRGYPRGLAGNEIPIAGRVCAAADVFDALTHDRVYRPAMSLELALETMRAGRGTQFDPDVLDALLHSVEQISAL